MAKDYLTLGSTPCGEDCASVGADDYYERMKIEAKAYIAQLKRMFPLWEEKNVRFVNKGHAHDFGTYHEIAVVFDDNDESAVDYAYEIDNGLPEAWDTIAQLAIDLSTNHAGMTYAKNGQLVPVSK